MKSSPLRSTTSSLISSVVLVLISFISSSLLAIITTEEAGELDRRNDAVGRLMATGETCWSLRPLNEDLGIGERSFWGSATVDGGAIEIAPNIVCCKKCEFLERVLERLKCWSLGLCRDKAVF